MMDSHKPIHKESLIGWKLSRWITLDTDGSMKGRTKPVGCEGLFRDWNGNFIKAFASHINQSSVAYAKLQGVHKGFKLS